MPRTARQAPGGPVYHVLNRAVARLPLFEKDGDYQAFERVLLEAMTKQPTRLLAYSLMPNHWHLVLWPQEDYQGRFKSFPVQADDHYYAVVRYVERNAFRANLVARAEQWRWSSLWQRQHPGEKMAGVLHPWPLPEPGDWLKRVNAAQSSAEFEALRRAVVRGSPFGSTSWQVRTARRLGLEFTLRPRGRPTKKKA